MSGSNYLRPFGRRGFGGNPLDMFNQMQQEMNRLFGEFGFAAGGQQQGQRAGRITPSAEVTEDNEHYRVSLELPGIDPQQVEVSLSGTTLAVRAERHDEHEHHAQQPQGQGQQGQQTQQGQRPQVLFTERSYGRIERIFELPNDIDTSRTDAQFRNGLLTITLAKSAQSRDQQRRIEVKADPQQQRG